MIDRFGGISNQLGNERLILILSKMFQWPMNINIYPWILAILESLTKSMKSEVVYYCAENFADRIAKQLIHAHLCQGSLQLSL